MENKLEYLDIELWEKVLDEDMNFHTGRTGSSKNIFHNTNAKLLPYLKDKSSALFVGSGFGGPAKYVARHTDVECELLTNAAIEYEHTRDLFTTHFKSVERFKPTKKYDIGIFVESLSSILYYFEHLIIDPVEGLKSICDSCDEILFLDVFSSQNEKIHNTILETQSYTHPEMVDLIHSMGYSIQHHVDWAAEDDDWMPLTTLRYKSRLNALNEEDRENDGVVYLGSLLDEMYERKDWQAYNLQSGLYHIAKK